MPSWLEYVGLLSPIASVGAVIWGALKAWSALEAKIATFAERLGQCSEGLEDLTKHIQALSERLARTEERVRGLELWSEGRYR